MQMDRENLSLLSRTVSTLSMDAVQKANSGHPGMPMGTADLASVLFSYYMRFNPQDPNWINRDRFVLSAGHGSMLLYSLLHNFGYDLSLDEIKNFRQWESKTPGHPEFGMTDGVETTTGPLGQGFANGVGMALSGKLLAKEYGEDVFNYRVFGIVSDGDLMEGVASEAGSMAGHLGLNNLIYFYDDNEISIGGSTDICFTESVSERFKSMGWFIQEVDGHDMDEIAAALDKAIKEPAKPSMIVSRTTIAHGSPNKGGTADSHGAPLGEEEIKLSKQALDWPDDKDFYIPKEVTEFCKSRVEEAGSAYSKWQKTFAEWKGANSDAAAKLGAQLNREIPAKLKEDLVSHFSNEQKNATRNLSGEALQIIAKHVPYLIGGSADLEPSNKTLIKDSTDIQRDDFSGRNIRFGVREHAMGSIVNGLAYTRSWIPYTGTFLVFADYMRPPIRLAALSHLQAFYIFTHDSFWVGEDGPTHQPIEHVASLRAIPRLYVFRPADGMETAGSYLAALGKKENPSTLLFTRQGVPPLEREKDFDVGAVELGAYVVAGENSSDLVLVATGSEVWLALDTRKKLAEKGVSARVVSMPCMELFLEQDKAYQDAIIPPAAKKVSLEAGIRMGWGELLGSDSLHIGIEHFGASAPGGVLAEKFGFTPDQTTAKILDWLS